MADRIVVMDGGRIAQVGPATEVYARPRSRFVASFIGEANIIDVVRDASGFLRPSIGGPPVPNETVEPGARIGVLRAESIRPAPPQTRDAVTAIVTDVVDTGGQVLVHLDAGGTSLMMRRLGDARGEFTVGQSIQVCWPATALHVIPEREP